jgi:MFS family permease
MQDFRKNVALLASCQALLFANNATLISVNALAGYALTETKSLATLPVTFWVCGAAAATLPASLLMRRLGRRGGFYLGSVLGVLAALLCTWAVAEGSFWGLCGGTFVFGMQNGIGHYYRFAAADISPADYKASAISMVLAGGVFGGLIGPEVSTLTIELLPARFAGTYLSLLAYILPTMLVLSWLRLPPAETAAQQGVARPMRVIARQPGFIVAVLCGAGAFAAMNLLMVSAALAMGFCGHPYSAAATVIGWHIFAMFAPSFFTGFLVRRIGLLRLMLVGVVLLYACVAVALSGQTVQHFWLALMLLGVAWNFLYIGGTTLLTESYQPAERAKTQGVNEIIVFVTQAVTSVASGLLVNSQGWDTVNYLSLPVITLIGVALLWLMLQRRAAERAAPVAASLSSGDGGASGANRG